MSKSFFFYDLETSGIDSRAHRIMQFAGQRTDMELSPVGEPFNILVKLTDDILPDPQAIMITGITPQSTLNDGISERELCQVLQNQVFTPGTITVGFNNIRFDDEFIRHTFWRNFYDPYEWAWSEDRSRWDLLDVVRITRTLRPDGVNWPYDADGKPVCKLELISAANGLEHTKAHDALSDVEALISVTGLIKQKQPKLFDYAFNMRGKRDIAKLVNLDNPQPFVYVSGRYDSAYEKATVAYPVAPGSKPGSVVVYDLRHSPTNYDGIGLDEMSTGIFGKRQERLAVRQVPVKELTYTRCPAVAPIGVLDDATQKRLGLNLDEIHNNLAELRKQEGLVAKIAEVYKSRPAFVVPSDIERRLYDSFTPERDKVKMSAVRAADAEGLADFHPDFQDERLSDLLLRYKARQFPQSLTADERDRWESYRSSRIVEALPRYGAELQRLAKEGADEFLLQELQLWAESIMPDVD